MTLPPGGCPTWQAVECCLPDGRGGLCYDDIECLLNDRRGGLSYDDIECFLLDARGGVCYDDIECFLLDGHGLGGRQHGGGWVGRRAGVPPGGCPTWRLTPGLRLRVGRRAGLTLPPGGCPPRGGSVLPWATRPACG